MNEGSASPGSRLPGTSLVGPPRTLVASAIRQRVATALVLAPLAVLGVLTLPTVYLALALALVVLIAAAEWAVLAGISSAGGRLAYIALVGGCIALMWLPARGWYIYFLAIASLCWVGITIFLLRVQRIGLAQGVDLSLIPLGILVLLGPWVAIVRLHALGPQGPLLVLFLLALIWTVDSLAFVAGRRWGRTKLAPLLSPGKTRIGVYAGLFGAATCGFVLGWTMGLEARQLAVVVVLCGVTACVSVAGDLFESLLKRRRALKDSGRLLPGHGGVLDRIDSLTAAAPVFVMGILWMEAHL
ncbi:MAG: phosphatidate cytidylyltransferase [Chromatiaceae bacterium]